MGATITKTRESALWSWVLTGVNSPDLILKRIENSVDRGTPDVLGCWGGLFICMELKVGIPRADGTVWCDVKPVQAATLIQFHRAHGSSWVLVQVGVGAAAKRFLISGKDAARLVVPIAVAELQKLTAIDPKSTSHEILKRVMSLW